MPARLMYGVHVLDALVRDRIGPLEVSRGSTDNL